MAENLFTLIRRKNDILVVSDVVVQWSSEGVINQMFPGSSPASPDIGVLLLKEMCSIPMIPIKLLVSKVNDKPWLAPEVHEQIT